MKNKILITLMFVVFCFGAARAQTNELTYQGKLNDGATAANGNYDFEFKSRNPKQNVEPISTRKPTNVNTTRRDVSRSLRNRERRANESPKRIAFAMLVQRQANTRHFNVKTATISSALDVDLWKPMRAARNNREFLETAQRTQ
jgi:hypothetical protein